VCARRFEALFGQDFSEVNPVAPGDVDLPGRGITAAALVAARLGAEDGGAMTGERVAVALRWELAKTSRVRVAFRLRERG
jgi:hypothetical protein